MQGSTANMTARSSNLRGKFKNNGIDAILNGTSQSVDTISMVRLLIFFFLVFQLLGKAWFVFIVVALDVLGSLRHTFSSNIFAIADKSLQGYPRRRTAYTFPFSKCHKTGHRNSLYAI
jgi:hypothetical protein